ncbi:MAG: NUDIX hydrolase [Geminicoccaceae bacterium]
MYRVGYPLARLWWRLFGGTAVGSTVALRCGDRLLVLRESYRRGLGLPAGGRKPGESALANAVRELHEEVGIMLQPDKLVMLSEVSFASEGRQIHNSFFEAFLDEPPDPVVDQREIVWAGWMEVEAITADEAQRGLRIYLDELGGRSRHAAEA